MFVLAANMWFQTLMRQFFFAIDKVVFNFIPAVYDLLISIARTSILSQADILNMADRIYKLLAVFMVFKVTFSLIMYVVNPDDFSDKSKGVGKLTTNIIISLSLLILTPYIFNYAYQLQTTILEENSLFSLIFGNDNNNNDNAFLDAGDTMAYTAITPFFSPNLGIDGLSECTQLTTKDANGDIAFNGDCDEQLKKLVADGDLDETTYMNYITGVSVGSLGLTFRQDMALATTASQQEFIIDYKIVFSTALGVIIVLLLITFCMDIGLRSIKLAFLQLIAPIPIISYIDPKSGKDGMFKKWYQMCFKTYLSLFVRLIAIYFAVYIISRIDRMSDIVDGSYVTNAFIKIFIIIGALMFAKQFPKILEGLGIKLDGDGKFFLNPLKKFEEQALGGKQILGAGAAGLAGAAAFGTNLLTTPSRVKNARGFFGKTGAIFSSIGGAIGATSRGLAGAVKGEKFGKNFTNSYSGAMRAKHDRAQRNMEGINPIERFGMSIAGKAGMSNYSEIVNAQAKMVEEGKGSAQGFDNAAKQKFGERSDRADQLKRAKDSSGKLYISKSNKELESDQKVIKAKQEGAQSVVKGKDKIEGLVNSNTGKIKEAERAVKEVESRKLDYYTDKADILLDRFKNSENPQVGEALAKYKNTDSSDYERSAALESLARIAQNEDRSNAKKVMDRAIAEEIVSDLADPNKKGNINSSFLELRSSVLASENNELIDEFNRIIHFDANGGLEVAGNTDEEKATTMMNIIDSFSRKGSLYGLASAANDKLANEESDISDILAVRAVQASDLQNSEEARRSAAIASTLSKK